jgi:hypothetical protein
MHLGEIENCATEPNTTIESIQQCIVVVLWKHSLDLQKFPLKIIFLSWINIYFQLDCHWSGISAPEAKMHASPLTTSRLQSLERDSHSPPYLLFNETLLTYLLDLFPLYIYSVQVVFFFDHFTDGRTPWTSGQLITRSVPKHRATQTHTKHSCFMWDSNPGSRLPS